MSSQKHFQASRHQSMQVLLALFSIIFIVIVAYGYYHLLQNLGWLIAFLGGLIIASFAWFLARVAGTGEGGIKLNWILIVPLFLISAAGVYNTMMVYLEGGQVLADAAASSQQRFAKVEATANGRLQADGVAKHMNRVNSLRDALFSEIKNPLNCGQGPEARRIVADLQKELPEFTPLSGPTRDCSQNESVIIDYNDRINALIARASWNDAPLNSIAAEAAKGRGALVDLQGEISRSYSPGDVRQITGIFEEMQSTYQNLVFRLGQKVDTSKVPASLDIVGAQSLGNVYRLPALFLSRLGVASTYVYLFIALGFDLLLVYLFQLTTRNRVKKHSIDSAIAGAW